MSSANFAGRQSSVSCSNLEPGVGARSYSLNTLNFQRSSGDCLCIYYRELSTLGLATQAGGCSCIYRELSTLGLATQAGGCSRIYRELSTLGLATQAGVIAPRAPGWTAGTGSIRLLP